MASPSPSSSATLGNPKADQIVHRFFTKLVLVVADARVTAINTDELHTQGRRAGKAKVDKWFNLETPDYDSYKAQLSDYKSISTAYPVPPPLFISVILSTPSNSAGKVLAHRLGGADPSAPSRLVRVRSSTPSQILLETHVLTLLPAQADPVELPQVYKQSISLFRSVYTLLRLLPAWKIYRKYKRRAGARGVASPFAVEIKVGTRLDDESPRFDAVLTSDPESNLTESMTFPKISTPLGALSLQSTYRVNSVFSLEPLESILSNHFLAPSPTSPTTPVQPDPLKSQLHFTPTLTSAFNRQRVGTYDGHGQSTSGSTSQPNSPPNSYPSRPYLRPTSSHSNPPSPNRRPVALPSVPDDEDLTSPTAVETSYHSRTVSSPFPSQSPTRPSPNPITGTGTAANTVRWPHRETELPFALPASRATSRVRKESLLGHNGDRQSTSVPPSPTTAGPSHSQAFAVPLSSRRISQPAIHPFKSATLSSSPGSIRQSPIAQMSSSPSTRLPNTTASASPRMTAISLGRGTPPLVHHGTPGSHASSIEKRFSASPSSGGGNEIGVPSPRRYSSSFGYRYGAVGSTGGGSEGSGSVGRGSVGGSGSGLGIVTGAVGDATISARRSEERPGLPQFAPNHDDDLTAFMQAIDARVPLRGGVGLDSPASGGVGDVNPSVDPSDAGPTMLTNRAEVDETLRRMAESFRVSLEGGVSTSSTGSSTVKATTTTSALGLTIRERSSTEAFRRRADNDRPEDRPQNLVDSDRSHLSGLGPNGNGRGLPAQSGSNLRPN